MAPHDSYIIVHCTLHPVHTLPAGRRRRRRRRQRQRPWAAAHHSFTAAVLLERSQTATSARACTHFTPLRFLTASCMGACFSGLLEACAVNRTLRSGKLPSIYSSIAALLSLARGVAGRVARLPTFTSRNGSSRCGRRTSTEQFAKPDQAYCNPF